MKLENPWIGYLDRSYRQVKSSIINRLKTATPEITDYSESNLLIIIVSIFSGIAEQLNFYIDNWAREGFLSTARRFSSVVKHTKLLDYRIKSYLPASVDLFVTYVDLNGDPVVITEQAVIPAGTVVRTANSVAFISQKTVLVEPGQSFGIIPTKQWERVEDVALGTTTNQGNQEYYIPGKYAHNTLELYVDGDPWLLQTTLARSLPTDKHFIINVGEDAVPYVQFGNGVKGKIPPANKPITADYNTTDGQSGNTISEGTITELDSVLVLPNPSVGVSIVNELKPIGGADIEDIEDIRTNAPLTIRTLDRAVTRQDFKDMVIQADGVAKANVVYNCGIDVEIYISPNGGGVADNTLLNDTKAYIEGVKIINRRIIMKGAGVTPVVIIAEVTPRFRVDKAQTKIDIEEELGRVFSFDNQDINGRIALSDLYATIDNLKRVDTVNILGLYTLPYPFPIDHLTPLDWVRETLPTSDRKAKWAVIWDGTNMRVYYNNGFQAFLAIGAVYIDPLNLVKFRINAGSYSVGQKWEFTSYKYMQTISMDDNTIPIIVAGQTTIITVN